MRAIVEVESFDDGGAVGSSAAVARADEHGTQPQRGRGCSFVSLGFGRSWSTSCRRSPSPPASGGRRIARQTLHDRILARRDVRRQLGRVLGQLRKALLEPV
jgi:hypothetical protein